ncbi:MAG: ABC transporter ATP-binding protein [Ruminococcus sp.]|nr:ABC transporter ATP-binding protein [Ruminococcus sp.]
MMASVVEIKDLVKRYKELTAVDGLSLSIEEGEIFGLLGPNGSGKTTTISCLLSLLDFNEGEITVFGEEMTPDNYSVKSRIGVIMQNVAVADELTVYENIDMFCGMYIKDKATRRQYVEQAIDFAGLRDYVKFRPKKLSGGLLRRLNIACGIAHKPKLIILDEPTVAVDPQSRNHILEGIEQLNREGATIIYTTHYMEEVEQICSRIAIIDHGKLIATGTKEELIAMIDHTETITAEVRDFDEALIDEIKALPHVIEAKLEEGKLTVSYSGGKHNLVRLVGLLNDRSVHLGRVYSELPTLNDVFLDITGRTLRD